MFWHGEEVEGGFRVDRVSYDGTKREQIKQCKSDIKIRREELEVCQEALEVGRYDGKRLTKKKRKYFECIVAEDQGFLKLLKNCMASLQRSPMLMDWEVIKGGREDELPADAIWAQR